MIVTFIVYTMSNIKNSSPICTNCTRVKHPQGMIGILDSFELPAYPGEFEYASHERLIRSDAVFVGVKMVYMKRLYIRATVNGRQKFKAFGWGCPVCGKVIKTMRKGTEKDIGLVRIVNKNKKKYLGRVRLPKKARKRIRRVGIASKT